jgi:hypothetical protein
MAGIWRGGGIKDGRLGNTDTRARRLHHGFRARGNWSSFGSRFAQARELQTEPTASVCALPVQIGISPLVGATESGANNRGKTWTTIATNHL